MRYVLTYISCLLFLCSCEYFKQDPEKTPIARVNDSYLYEDDIKSLISENTTKEDSTLIINNFINRWATQQLLIDQARINLSEEKLAAYDKLVKEYKDDLYTEAYKGVIVSKQLDSTVSVRELQDFYDLNKENFKLRDDLVKVRYIWVDPNYSNIAKARQLLDRFNDKDKTELSTLSIQFKEFNFNDSIWVKREALVSTLTVLKDNSDQVLKKSNFTQLQDSLGVYLVKIEDILKPNDIAPLSHIEPTIKQIILNKRKLELIKKLEKDITKDAIKNKKFETYTPH
ncbi:MAG: peptidyl-prolyl cis-trans isomerase [Altibacter sp.]|uniref:peptidyl-prolyl cis-trans isomerase n=1 Tax=Altibacter sp. TaxID=2024823 RepID=UPI001D7C3607|nr:peptidyl-prolyl cis-trans isomerase [Altibacter sp.]MBZ0326840.1 peptidyl-prolyl cis-trans isomerase [Altibacter sp.]